MPNTAPGAERVADGVEGSPAPASRARAGAWRWRWAGLGVFLLLVVVLFDAYLHLSKTYAENSDEANILLMASDMLHGNLYLSGWNVSDVPFISTELPQMALLVWLFGLHLNTAHIAAATTYTLVVAIAMVLAKGKAHKWQAVARMALVLGIMLAPQPGVGIFVVIFSVGHIGTALPVMLTWLVIDRAGRRWWVLPVAAVMLAWAETTDPLVLVIAIFPVVVVCAVRLLTAALSGVRQGGHGGALAGLRAALLSKWFEVGLAVAAGLGYTIAWIGGHLLRRAGGYVQNPVLYQFDSPDKWFMQTRIVVHGLLEMFGAYFVPGPQSPQGDAPPLGGLDQVIAYTHLIGVVLAIWGACAIARRFFFRDADFVSQLLLAGIVANVFAYLPTTLADHSALNTREIAPVLPFAAVLAGRMLGDRLLRAPLGGPLATFRLPGKNGGGKNSGKKVGVRVIAASLVVLLGWFGFGLWRQADTPAAPTPYTQLVADLENMHLTYGVGGYWQASLITVESGGAVTIRAVTPACLQPYKWESKPSWYDPSQHAANFLLLSNVPGYFSKFAVTPGVLLLLNQWFPHQYINTGGVLAVQDGNQIYNYQTRVYQGNLLAVRQKLVNNMTNPPPWLVKKLKGKPPVACG
ncbi:MAG TPA: hypothetical protein VG164_06845 [Trebonia sp.]|jgi:hypothetical protein|nr:hypothetical protein [Trebonia sp.]